MEIWKPLNQCKDYMISSYGRIKSLKRGREIILKPSYTHDGYVKQAISINGKSITYRVHRLVAEHFISNPNNKKTINHIDGNKKNNHVENLEWVDLSEQMIHAYYLGLKKPVQGTLQGNAVLTEEQVREIREIYKPRDKQYGMIALAKKYGVSEPVINRVAHGRSYKNVK